MLQLQILRERGNLIAWSVERQWPLGQKRVGLFLGGVGGWVCEGCVCAVLTASLCTIKHCCLFVSSPVDFPTYECVVLKPATLERNKLPERLWCFPLSLCTAWAITAISVNKGEFPQGSYSYICTNVFRKSCTAPFYIAVKVCGLTLLEDAYI